MLATCLGGVEGLPLTTHQAPCLIWAIWVGFLFSLTNAPTVDSPHDRCLVGDCQVKGHQSKLPPGVIQTTVSSAPCESQATPLTSPLVASLWWGGGGEAWKELLMSWILFGLPVI